MKNKKILSFALFAGMLAIAQIASAAPTLPCTTGPDCFVEDEGPGGNDTLPNAQALSPPDLGIGDSVTVDGEISSLTDIDFYKIVLTATSDIIFDIDFADDVCPPGTDPTLCFDVDEGLDGLLSVFSSDGRLLAYSDDSDFPEDPGSYPNGAYDSLLAGLVLDPGTYYVVVSDNRNEPTALSPVQSGITQFPLQSGTEVLGATPDSTFFLSLEAETTGPYQLTIIMAADADADGVSDLTDNCINVANSLQEDTDADGHGNICDGDFNQTCGAVDFTDLTLFKGNFFTSSPLHDLNSTGGPVDFTDLNLFKGLFFQLPGPSPVGSLCNP